MEHGQKGSPLAANHCNFVWPGLPLTNQKKSIEFPDSMADGGWQMASKTVSVLALADGGWRLRAAGAALADGSWQLR
jgi:hypothetical protein